ncbi:MAG: hypothetical protein U0795_18045 [Pirellulales bacterium]
MVIGQSKFQFRWDDQFRRDLVVDQSWDRFVEMAVFGSKSELPGEYSGNGPVFGSAFPLLSPEIEAAVKDQSAIEVRLILMDGSFTDPLRLHYWSSGQYSSVDSDIVSEGAQTGAEAAVGE